jgi:hypothetical protein
MKLRMGVLVAALALQAGSLEADSGRVKQRIAVKALSDGHEIQGSNAILLRDSDDGLDILATTKELDPSEVVDIFIAVFNHPSACTHPNPVTGSPCSPPDLFDPDTVASLHYVASPAANPSGHLTVDAALAIGDLSTCAGPPFPCNGLLNVFGSEVHLPLFSPAGPGRQAAQWLPVAAPDGAGVEPIVVPEVLRSRDGVDGWRRTLCIDSSSMTSS